MGDPLTLKDKLKDPEHNNWLKAVLILRELKVGISSFVEVRCSDAQGDVLRNVLNYLPPHVTAVPQCTTCTRTSLETNIACPQNVCPVILQEINRIHRDRHIQLSCTDVSAWTDTSRCWELAKTFIMGKGYGDKRSAADTDCAGLLSIIINCVWIHKSLTENMRRSPTVFHEVKNLRNDVMHSPDNRLSDALLQVLIKACVQILDDPKILASEQTAIAARERIKEIEGMILTVSNVDFPSVFLEVENNLKQEISDIAGKQASQEEDISDIAGKQALQEEDISDIAGKQASQEEDISDLARKQASQEEDILELAGKQALQGEDISDLAGKQALQEKDVSYIAGRQASHEEDISDLAGKQALQEQDISDSAKQQALHGNELQGRVEVLERDIKQLQTTTTDSMDQLGAAKLKEQILKGYQKDLSTVFETSFVDGVSAIHMFSPIIIRQDLENQLSDNSPVRQGASAAASPILHHSGKVEQIQSYRDIFFKDGQLQRNIVLLGEACVGKTTFCNHIVNLWCLVQTDDCQRDLTENDQALVGVLKEFEYVFVVRCRDTKEQPSVLSMIKDIFCSGEDEPHIDTIFRYKTKQCLVIIDGLDEWMYTSSVGQGKNSLHVLPDCTKIRGATIIMTSRPWKVEALNRNSLLGCRVLQLEGLDRKGVEKLTRKFIQALEPSVTDHEQLCEHFLMEVFEQEMGDIVKQPFLLFSIIESWLLRNHKLHRSLTMNYAALINSVLYHSDDKLSDKDKKLGDCQGKQSLPGCFTEMQACLTHSGSIRKISALAFKTLVLKEKERSLVFSKEDLIDDVGEDCLHLCLKLGILSETKASSLARVKHVTISFIHKSVQEYFAAVHLSEDKADLCLTEFTSKLNSLNEVFDHALILIFLFGMSPSKGQTVLNHVYGVVDQCSEIKAYRQFADSDIFGLAPDHVKICRRLFNQLYVRCAVELNNTASSATSLHTSSQPNLYIPDVLIDERTPDDVANLLFCSGEHVKSLTYIDNRKTPCHVIESLESMTNIEKLIVLLSNDHLDEHIDLIIQSIPYLQQLQSFRLDIPSTQHMMWFLTIHRTENDVFTLSVPQSTRLVTELGKLTNLVSVSLSRIDLTTVEKVEFPKNLCSVYLSNMIVSSDLFAHMPSSCTEVHLECLNCNGGDLVFPSTCTTLSCSNVSCTGDLLFPSTCTTLNCRNVSCEGDLVFPSTCTTLNCSYISCKGDMMFPSTCTTLNCYYASHTGTGDLVFPSTCTTLNCSGVSCTGKLVFPLFCTKLILARMSLPDLAVLPDSLISLDMEDVTLTQAAEEQLCRGFLSTSTLQRLSVCGGNNQYLYLYEHLDLSSYWSLHSLELGRILMDSCGVVVPHNVREIRMWGVTLSQEYWYQLVQNIYTCHNVIVSLMGVTINEATLKYIRQHFSVTHEDVLPYKSDLTDEEKTDITEDRKNKKDEKNDRTDEKNDITDEKNDIPDEENQRTDEKNDRTDEKNDRTDEKENNRKYKDNDFTTVKRDIEFHTKCPENK